MRIIDLGNPLNRKFDQDKCLQWLGSLRNRNLTINDRLRLMAQIMNEVRIFLSVSTNGPDSHFIVFKWAHDHQIEALSKECATLASEHCTGTQKLNLRFYTSSVENFTKLYRFAQDQYKFNPRLNSNDNIKFYITSAK